jgi:hypothetical protein
MAETSNPLESVSEEQSGAVTAVLAADTPAAYLDSVPELSTESKRALEAWLQSRQQQPQPKPLQSAGAPAEWSSAVKSIVAHLTEAPMNWHQVTVFALSRQCDGEDETLRRKGPLLFAVGALMVLMQTTTVIGVLQGTLYPSCKNNDQCPSKGTFCAIGGRYPSDPNCWYCGTTAPLGAQLDKQSGGILNHIEAGDLYAGMNSTYARLMCNDPINFVWGENLPPLSAYPAGSRGVKVGFGTEERREQNPLWIEYIKSWCDACFHLETGTVSETTGWSIPADNITTMGLADFITYLFTALFVALTLVGELKDIRLCSFSIAAAADRLNPRWITALRFLNGVRTWVFLPAMIITVLYLVIIKGGDALTVVLNTVAILFLCEVDNAAYMIGLVEAIRSRVEYAGRIALSADQSAELWWMKACYLIGVPLALALPLPLMATNKQMYFISSNLIPFLVYLMIGIADELGPPGGGATPLGRSCIRAIQVVGFWFAGIVGFVVTLALISRF